MKFFLVDLDTFIFKSFNRPWDAVFVLLLYRGLGEEVLFETPILSKSETKNICTFYWKGRSNNYFSTYFVDVCASAGPLVQ